MTGRITVQVLCEKRVQSPLPGTPWPLPRVTGVDRSTGRPDDSFVDSPHTPRGLPQDTNFDARLLKLLALKREMELLHAQLQCLKLMLKLGVRLL
jgi:hypothetical protein